MEILMQFRAGAQNEFHRMAISMNWVFTMKEPEAAADLEAAKCRRSSSAGKIKGGADIGTKKERRSAVRLFTGHRYTAGSGTAEKADRSTGNHRAGCFREE